MNRNLLMIFASEQRRFNVLVFAEHLRKFGVQYEPEGSQVFRPSLSHFIRSSRIRWTYETLLSWRLISASISPPESLERCDKITKKKEKPLWSIFSDQSSRRNLTVLERERGRTNRRLPKSWFLLWLFHAQLPILQRHCWFLSSSRRHRWLLALIYTVNERRKTALEQ